MNFKVFICTLLFGMGLLSGCSNKTNVTPQEATLKGTWNLIHLSGGFAGLDEHFQNGTITWTFNTQNQTITVNNTNQASTGFTFGNGTYNYEIVEVNNQEYIHIESSEYGGLNLSTQNLIIDQNVISNSVGADGFKLSFEK